MKHFEVIDSFTEIHTLNGVNVEVEIEIAVTEDDTPPEGGYLARYQAGELFMGLIRVTAKALGCEGSEYLGANPLKPGLYDADVMGAVADHAMIAPAVRECLESIAETANRFAPFIDISEVK